MSNSSARVGQMRGMGPVVHSMCKSGLSGLIGPMDPSLMLDPAPMPPTLANPGPQEEAWHPKGLATALEISHDAGLLPAVWRGSSAAALVCQSLLCQNGNQWVGLT